MIDFLFDVLGTLFIPKRKGEFPRERHRPPPNAKLKMPSAKRAYERWAKERAFEVVDGGYRATIGGKLIRIRTGLEGSAPIAVEIEANVDHGAPTVLVTAGTAAADAPPATRHITRALFEDPEFVFPIRSIGFAPGMIRIRMPPLTPPEVVARVLELFEEADVSAKGRAFSSAYRG